MRSNWLPSLPWQRLDPLCRPHRRNGRWGDSSPIERGRLPSPIVGTGHNGLFYRLCGGGSPTRTRCPGPVRNIPRCLGLSLRVRKIGRGFLRVPGGSGRGEWVSEWGRLNKPDQSGTFLHDECRLSDRSHHSADNVWGANSNSTQDLRQIVIRTPQVASWPQSAKAAARCCLKMSRRLRWR